VRRAYRRVQVAAITIQSAIRGCIARAMYEEKSISARVIAVACVTFLRRKREAHKIKRESAAKSIAELYRSMQVRTRYKLIRTKTVTIQSLIRMNKQRRTFKLRKATSQAAALRLVTWYRSHTLRRRQLAATAIQRRLRSYLNEKCSWSARTSIDRRSKASSVIAVWYKSCRAKHSLALANASAMKIQAEWRAKNARDEYLIMKGAVLFLEAWVRECVLPQINWNRDVAACIIQAWVRSVQARKKFASMRRAARILHAQELLADSTILAGASNQGSEKRLDGDHDELITELTSRIEQYKQTVATLQSEVEQVTEFASRHAQEMEAEFEEKVSLYEDEVLAMKQEIIEAKNENQRLKDAMEAAEKEHEKTLKTIQKGVQKTQASHRDYLDKIMALLDDTEVARKTDTDRIREELEILKRERDSKIASLKEEIELLRSFGFGAKNATGCPPGSLTQGARKLAQKLKLSLSPDNILRVVKEAQERSGKPQRYIDSKISIQAMKHISYLEEMIQIADIAATEQAALVRAEKQQLQDLEIELSRAYQEHGRLQRKGFI
jgi:myosin heavy subunit